MNEITAFKTPSGDEMVVLSRAEYEALLDRAEMAEDVAAYDAAMKRQADGTAVSVPSEFVDRLLDGENRIRVWREFRKLSAEQLAQAAGVSMADLCELETGKTEASVSVLKAIARALRLDLDDLV